MTPSVEDLWSRAERALQTVEILKDEDPDAAASRAYYAAFYAVSALFLDSGVSFRKHSALEAAVHRDLINTGRWDESLGRDYKFLSGLRRTADYGGSLHVTCADAAAAVAAARRVVEAVAVLMDGVMRKTS